METLVMFDRRKKRPESKNQTKRFWKNQDDMKYDYLLVIDTTDLIPLGLSPTNQISCCFQFPVHESEIFSERFFSDGYVYRSYCFHLEVGCLRNLFLRKFLTLGDPSPKMAWTS